MKNKTSDLLYCGGIYDRPDISEEVIKDLRTLMPDLQYEDDYDDYKGHRLVISIEDGESDNYFACLIALGMFRLSLHFGIMMMDGDRSSDIERILALAKSKYPKYFKQDGNE